MNKKEYFQNLIYLFEATGLDDDKEQEVEKRQSEISDTGEDVFPGQDNNNNNLEDESNPNELEPELDDANYMQVEEPVQTADITTVLDNQKMKNLFDLFMKLKTYAEMLYDGIRDINTDVVDEKNRDVFFKYTSNIKVVSDKISEYLKNVFVNDKYERVIYSYILLRTEFLVNVKELRRILGINNLEEK